MGLLFIMLLLFDCTLVIVLYLYIVCSLLLVLGLFTAVVRVPVSVFSRLGSIGCCLCFCL